MTTGAAVQPPTSSSSTTRSSRYMKGGSLDSRYSSSIASSQRYIFGIEIWLHFIYSRGLSPLLRLVSKIYWYSITAHWWIYMRIVEAIRILQFSERISEMEAHILMRNVSLEICSNKYHLHHLLQYLSSHSKTVPLTITWIMGDNKSNHSII